MAKRAAKTPTPYDTVPYPGIPFPQTHPDRLATHARLFGLDAPAPQTCRVLEVGCGDGNNLLPMAYGLPGATFVGIDLSRQAIARARARARAVGAENATFGECSLTAYEPDPGSFDYVIAHGVYSWVDDAVRDALLALCGRALSPTGVAYVSYNALPGGHLREIVRGLLLTHLPEVADPQRRLAEARRLLRWWSTLWADDKELGSLSRLAASLAGETDALLFHDTLSPMNTRRRFEQFVAHAAEHDLQYVAEANFWDMRLGKLPDGLRERVLAVEDRVQREQLLDDLRMRSFRQTLLCHRGPELSEPVAERIAPLAVSALATVATDDGAGNATFSAPNGANMTTDNAVLIAGLQRVVAAWPAALAVDDLLPADARPQDRELVLGALLRCYSAALVHLHTTPPGIGDGAGERPATSPIARLQVEEESTLLTNLRHENVRPTARMRRLVKLLDAGRDRADLLGELRGASDAPADEAQLRAWLDDGLRELARHGLLLAS
jgi:SAM-dependent methyltransferase